MLARAAGGLVLISMHRRPELRHTVTGQISTSLIIVLVGGICLFRFFGQDAKGKQLPDYLSKLAVHLADEQQDGQRQADRARLQAARDRTLESPVQNSRQAVEGALIDVKSGDETVHLSVEEGVFRFHFKVVKLGIRDASHKTIVDGMGGGSN